METTECSIQCLQWTFRQWNLLSWQVFIESIHEGHQGLCVIFLQSVAVHLPLAEPDQTSYSVDRERERERELEVRGKLTE